MNDLGYSEILRNLSSDYYDHKITREEYRMQRNALLDKLDEEYNGKRKPMPEQDIKESDQSLFMKTISFLKNKDVNR